MDEYPATPAHYYDGLTAVRREGAVRRVGETLRLDGEGETLTLPAAALRRLELQPSRAIYGWTARPDFRLILPREVPPGLAAVLPGGGDYGGWIDRLGLGRAVLAFGAASAALVAAVLTAPEWLGPRIPSGWERAIGTAMVGDLDSRLCHTPEGDAALAKLLGKVDPAPVKVRAGIAKVPIVNAVALPGETVLLFDGLVQEAESADELAGVLAHEVGHVRERHVMTAMMRQFGLSILLAGADSGLVSSASGLASLGYTRAAEGEADRAARARLAAANISPLATAAFFERLSGERAPEPQAARRPKDDAEKSEEGVLGWIASHPAPAARAQAFRAAHRPGHRYTPALSAGEFAALKAACRRDRTAKAWNLF